MKVRTAVLASVLVLGAGYYGVTQLVGRDDQQAVYLDVQWSPQGQGAHVAWEVGGTRGVQRDEPVAKRGGHWTHVVFVRPGVRWTAKLAAIADNSRADIVCRIAAGSKAVAAPGVGRCVATLTFGGGRPKS